MISPASIDLVFETARIEEVIGDFVQLKKAGSNYKGLSPFSEERTPSFMVSPTKQIWKDFSTGKGGNAVSFLMEHEHFTYPEAIRFLAKKYNIELEETAVSNADIEEQNERESLYLVTEYASAFFHNTLLETDLGKAIGLSYFKERGFTLETIKQFNLGYAIDAWSNFTDAALKQGYKLDYLEKTGLTIVKDDKQFDRFKGRVIFPIKSLSGRVLGFGGRILTNDKKAAKYLNSPDSDIYHKSNVLFGIYQAKQSIAKEDNCFLVEGYTDVIQMHQTGVTNVVASSGTALTTEQIRLIHRLTNNITVLFDGDAAGLRASLRGIDLILEQGMNVKICTFSEGEDPDSFARQNTYDTVYNFITENAKDFIQFKANLLVNEAQNDPIKKAETIRDIVNSIAKIPDRIKKEIYIKECAKIMDISEQVLFSTLAQINVKALQSERNEVRQQTAFEVVKNQQQPTEKVDVLYILERKIIEILLLYGNKTEVFEDIIQKEVEGKIVEQEETIEVKVFERVYLALQEDEMEFNNPQFKALYEIILNNYTQHPNGEISNLLNTLDVNLSEEISNIIMDDERYTLSDWERKNIFPKDKHQTIPQLVTDTILKLRCLLIDNIVKKLQQDTFTHKSEVNTEIIEEVMNYTGLRTRLSKKLNRVI